ncbi:hypothetical protein RV11_GL003148 [Enterococcus phoeniculicola]|uniref:AgrB-like protein n=1 Tax=Enterococcus phoeniculicola ATCC BAA-412 TaxID=1158610 RepID=R3TNF7_9ENTE|nr:accessory gene regulator B family protein [Enterococcus phoeniculicola]EOL43034.1 hypothetical protein UC3_02011 [Enterococcus phoeniculicola ATCC BAA-412]EOT76608.1 hypothetical protein I589_01565 [Enterococcus phoeniculicola ATCC BAA-412]OJG72177.1 hypothetical protein RV11_GL003148 [Enterococcus phoeniculicola]
MFEEKLAVKLTKCLLKDSHLDNYLQAKIEYGIAILIVNLFKVIIIVASAEIFFSLSSTLYCYIPYCIIRSNSFGYHAKTSLVCSVQSILAFSIVPFIIKTGEYSVGKLVQVVVIIPLVYLLSKTAPSLKKNRSISSKKKKILKNKSIFTTTALFSLSLTFSSINSTITFFGIVLVIILTIPNKF